jgi:hypothetical protein
MRVNTGANPPDPGQGIVLRTGFFRLDWTLRFTRTTVTIDGHRHELAWGEQFFPLEPGRHRLQVSYRYLRLSVAGKASIDVDVPRTRSSRFPTRHRSPCSWPSCQASSPSRRTASPEHATALASRGE